jgi:hypothetical protein
VLSIKLDPVDPVIIVELLETTLDTQTLGLFLSLSLPPSSAGGFDCLLVSDCFLDANGDPVKLNEETSEKKYVLILLCFPMLLLRSTHLLLGSIWPLSRPLLTLPSLPKS